MTILPTVFRVILHSDAVLCDTTQILAYAADGHRPTAVAQAVTAVIKRSSPERAYDVALAMVGTMLADQRQRQCSLDYPGIEQAPYDLRWTAQFVSTYANADAAMTVALFDAAAADGQLVNCLSTLAASTAATIRRRYPALVA